MYSRIQAQKAGAMPERYVGVSTWVSKSTYAAVRSAAAGLMPRVSPPKVHGEGVRESPLIQPRQIHGQERHAHFFNDEA